MIPSGEFYMGAGDDKWALARELPKHKVRVDSFYMDIHEVTNRQFEEFVNATGYKTVAELRKVKWPSGDELGQYFLVVLVFVLLIIAYVSGLDVVFGWVVIKLFGH